MRKILIAALILLPVSASAQQAPESPQVRALNMRIGAEINANLQCSTAVVSLQDQLTAAQAENKRLADKYEPKKEEPKKP